ncbi:hypothetical protein GCM10023176_06720 [Micromonospora coerulea]|uniref:Uncharacterized protein n=1 Tax=Micromonospora coerulea TaxID=47856 RepID=A0ABP8S6D4_9ACTN
MAFAASAVAPDADCGATAALLGAAVATLVMRRPTAARLTTWSRRVRGVENLIIGKPFARG